jgi:Co/Zn/Cd efflux system component
MLAAQRASFAFARQLIGSLAGLLRHNHALALHADPVGDAEERDLSVAAILLDTVADAPAAAGVAAAGGIILITGGWYWLDPAVALAVAVVVAYHALALIRKVLGRLRSAAAG